MTKKTLSEFQKLALDIVFEYCYEKNIKEINIRTIIQFEEYYGPSLHITFPKKELNIWLYDTKFQIFKSVDDKWGIGDEIWSYPNNLDGFVKCFEAFFIKSTGLSL